MSIYFPFSSLHAEQPDAALIGDIAQYYPKPITLTIAHEELKIEVYDLAYEAHSGADLVLVGQGISIKTVYLLMRDLGFTQVQLNCHAMHMRYAQQVIELTINDHMPDPVRLITEAAKYHIDIFPKAPIALSEGGVLVMDMDSTVIEIECIDEIAGLAGLKSQVAEVTEAAMRGEIAFTESLHHRVACLAGIDLDKLHSIRRRIPFSPKFLLTMQVLKENGWKLVLASGGFTFFAEYIARLANLDHAYANQLGTEHNKLTGTVIGEVVDAKRKAEILIDTCQQYDIPTSKSIAIGDGANDLLMMRESAWSVAYRAKAQVQEEANAAINISQFDSLLYMLR